MLIVIIITALIFSALSIFLFYILNPKSPNIDSSQSQKGEITSSIENDNLVYSTREDLAKSADTLYFIEHKNIDEVMKMLDSKINVINSEEVKEKLNLYKIHIISNLGYDYMALDALEKLPETYPNITETCEYNSHGYTISRKLNLEKQNEYQQKVKTLCIEEEILNVK